MMLDEAVCETVSYLEPGEEQDLEWEEEGEGAREEGEEGELYQWSLEFEGEEGEREGEGGEEGKGGEEGEELGEEGEEEGGGGGGEGKGEGLGEGEEGEEEGEGEEGEGEEGVGGEGEGEEGEGEGGLPNRKRKKWPEVLTLLKSFSGNMGYAARGRLWMPLKIGRC